MSRQQNVEQVTNRGISVYS